MPWILLLRILFAVRDLLLVVVTPAVDVPLLSDCHVVSVPTHNLKNFLRDAHELGFAVALFKEGGCRGSAL
jgi:hypothetical protein